MLGVLVVIAIVAAVSAVHSFSSLVGDNSKDELSRYLDDHAHTTVDTTDGGFRAQFPVPPVHDTEPFPLGVRDLEAQRYDALVDDEIHFDILWVDVPGTIPADTHAFLAAIVPLQAHKLGGTVTSESGTKQIGPAIARDFDVVHIDNLGAKHYITERLLFRGRRVWVVRLSSHIRRDAAFQRFAGSFTLKH